MKHFLALIASLWLGIGPLALARADEGAGEPTLAGTLNQLVPKLRAEKDLIGLAAMAMVDGKLVASAVDGERKKSSGVTLEIGDQWHLGSITKSVTATMIARLIEQKKLAWTDTVGERFGDTVKMDPGWRDARLEQLLTHTAGAPANFPILTNLKQPAEGADRVSERLAAVAAVLQEPPASPPGKGFAYSNVGFTIAAVMAEQATGRPWEDLVRQEVFTPLKLTSAGFGPPHDGAKPLSQPRGHSKLGPFKMAADEDSDNSPIMGPAGSIHMTLADLCTYAGEHMRGEQGAGTLLTSASYQKLHTPNLQDYSCGWVVPTPKEPNPHRVLWHNGSNTRWYAFVAILPDQNVVLAVASNDGDIEAAEAAATEILKECEASLTPQP